MAKAKRKEVEQVQVAQAAPIPEQREVRAANVMPLHQIMITTDLDGHSVDVAQVPQATAQDVVNIGTFAQRIAYNLLAGRLNPEIRDTSFACWSDVPRPVVNAFRKVRDYGDKNDNGNPGSAIRAAWAKHVAEKAEKKETAAAEGKKSGVRLRKPTLSGLASLIKDAAPKGGGIAAMKEKIREHLKKLADALFNVEKKNRNEKTLHFHLQAALALTEATAKAEPAKVMEQGIPATE